jgi:transcriptional regulator GlxA family with amidase domain
VRTSSRNFAVLLFDEVELWDVAAVMQVASHAGRHWNWRPFRLLPTALRIGLIETRSQIRIEATVSLESCPAPEIVFVPGGYGARRAAEDGAVTAWCAKVCATAELTLAVGAGVMVLGAAGLLEGAEVAATKASREWLERALPGTRFNESDAIVASKSGKLLTSGSSVHGVDLGLAAVERFLGAKMAADLRSTLGHPQLSRIELPGPIKITLPPR